MFIGNGHLTSDSWNWLEVTLLSSTASVLKDVRISLEIPSFYSKNIFYYIWIRWFQPLDYHFNYLSGYENLGGLNDNIYELKDLNSLFGLKKSQKCLHFTYWVISLASGTSAASMTLIASMTSTASFHQNIYCAWCFH